MSQPVVPVRDEKLPVFVFPKEKIPSGKFIILAFQGLLNTLGVHIELELQIGNVRLDGARRHSENRKLGEVGKSSAFRGRFFVRDGPDFRGSPRALERRCPRWRSPG